MSFASKLIDWYAKAGRELPWRATQDAYTIWLSEIILQQTRVEQGMPYFYRFAESYPDVRAFANASEEDLLRLWQGLGYYSRARNMHKAAKMVMEQFAGVFPSSYAEAIKLPGVGEYTAAAIASFASNEAVAVVDGNVYRVLSRYFGIHEAINSTKGKKIFAELAQELLDKDRASIYNQAIMDFGALQCKPKNPNCDSCIFRTECTAYSEGEVEFLPVKIKAKPSRNRYFHYFLVLDGESLLMAKRGLDDVWANLYEFPMIETEAEASETDLPRHPHFPEFFGAKASVKLLHGPVKHILSHQNIYAKFYVVETGLVSPELREGWSYVPLEDVDSLAKHKLIFTFLETYKQILSV